MFKIALTPLLACAADPYVPTPVSGRAGDGAGGAGVAGLARSWRRQPRSWPHAGRDAAGGARSVAAKGRGHRVRCGDPNSHSVPEGGVCVLPRPWVCRGHWGHSWRTIMSPSAQAPDTK